MPSHCPHRDTSIFANASHLCLTQKFDECGDAKEARHQCPTIPNSTVIGHVQIDPEGLTEQFARAQRALEQYWTDKFADREQHRSMNEVEDLRQQARRAMQLAELIFDREACDALLAYAASLMDWARSLEEQIKAPPQDQT